MKSPRLILRPFTIDDVEDIFLYAKDSEVTKYLTWSPHNELSQTEIVLREIYMSKSGIYAIELKSEYKCIGCIDLRIDNENNKGSFGYVLNKDYWNKGYMTEALNLILNYVFTQKKLNRMESTHYIGNEASGRVMQKCGMKYEGTGLQEVRIKEIYYDVIHYAILRNDWFNLINKE